MGTVIDASMVTALFDASFIGMGRCAAQCGIPIRAGGPAARRGKAGLRAAVWPGPLRQWTRDSGGREYGAGRPLSRLPRAGPARATWYRRRRGRKRAWRIGSDGRLRATQWGSVHLAETVALSRWPGSS